MQWLLNPLKHIFNCLYVGILFYTAEFLAKIYVIRLRIGINNYAVYNTLYHEGIARHP